MIYGPYSIKLCAKYFLLTRGLPVLKKNIFCGGWDFITSGSEIWSVTLIEKKSYKVVPWLLLVVCLLRCTIEFHPRSVCEGLTVDVVKMGQVSHQSFGFPLSVSLHQSFIYTSLICLVVTNWTRYMTRILQHSTIVCSAHTVFMCFVFIWEQTATCATCSINWLVFITEMKSVYCAVRTGSLNKAVCASSLKG